MQYKILSDFLNEVKINLPTENLDHLLLLNKINILYSNGFSALDLIEWIKNLECIDDAKKSTIELCFQKVKSEYRCEKLLMLYMLNQVYELLHVQNNVIFMNNVGFI